MGRKSDFRRKPSKQSGNRHHKKHQSFKERDCKSFNKTKNFIREKQFSKETPTPIIANLKEDQVGITEYISPGKGFTGIIKARFSDFLVNEIDLDGVEVRLTDEKVPLPADDTLGDEVLERNKKELSDIVTDDIWKRLESLVLQKNNDKKDSVDIDVTELDKDRRTLIHKTLKEHFGASIISTTSNIDEKKFIQCFKSKGTGDIQRNRWTWSGEYVYFVVHKENMDTVRSASDLARNLRLRPSLVNYAGTKDKRAKTTQMFCVKKRDPKSIAQAARPLRYLKVGNFSFKDKVLKLGDLKGNRFRIAIRHIEAADEEEIEKSLNSIKNDGFINYYGLQRFGNSVDVPTYEVGVALLKSDYKLACELILKPREGDPIFLKEIREFWWKTRNSVQAAAKFRDNKFIEKKLLDGLADFGENDYANALRRIPRNMLLLYTHSYQSLVWNRIVSRRIKEFGLKILPGDLVLKDKTKDDMVETVDVLDATVAECIDQAANEIDDESDPNVESEYKAMVQPITEEDIANNRYSIFDVVLPLPGYDITYPSNEIDKWYEEILAERELTSEKLKHSVKTYSLAGAYRKLLVKPENVQWEFKRYDSPTSVLIASDSEILEDKKADDDIPDGKYKALLLDFVLPSSAYATMVLREILKSDTSAASQQKLTEELMRETNVEMNLTNNQTIEGLTATVEEDVKDETNNENINEKTDTEDSTAAAKRKASPNDDENSVKKVKSE